MKRVKKLRIPKFKKPTRCFDLYCAMTKGNFQEKFETIEAHTTVNSIEAKVREKYSTHNYLVTIKPLR